MRNLVLVVLCTFLCYYTFAQDICGFDRVHELKLKSDPAYARTIEANNASIQKIIQRKLSSGSLSRTDGVTYTIPVVVHVMHTGGAIGSLYNPTDAQIIGAIAYLNSVYAGTYAGMIPQVGSSTINEMPVRFALAQRTPSCGATNGIERIDASSIPNYAANGVRQATSNGCTDGQLKDFARWNVADYYNIYVVNKIDGADGTAGQFIAGYAYFPGAGNLDGTVMLATQMITGQKTLPHEVGHALGLYHTFEGSSVSPTCPANSDCSTQGDRVCDTDPVYNNVTGGIYNFSCRSGNNPCVTPAANYNVNTESNFMAYTNCYHLFTLGQRDRMDAAMSLPSRSSLVSAGNLSLLPCGTTVNFSQAAASVTENSTGTTNGCRMYTDYTYQLGIGAAPSANATATISVSGSATQGVDYDITTNGNFSSPSTTLTFATGSTSAQTITLRVYDDAADEVSENVVIDFTLNNGGGDASKGTLSPTLTVTLNDNDIAPVGNSSATYTIGQEISLSSVPFDATLAHIRSQFLYKPAELQSMGMTAGSILSYGINIEEKNSLRPFTNFTIKMGQVVNNYLVDLPGSVSAYNGLTTVYSTASYSTVAGWNSFTLSTPFTWDGTSSLLVEICFDNGTTDPVAGTDYVLLYPDGGTTSQGNTIFQTDIGCGGSFGSLHFYQEGYKPEIQLGETVTGTQVESTLNATTSLHVGTGSNDYVYSEPADKLMVSLQNVNANLGCVTATLEAAGTNWQGYSGGQRSAKVFAVTPTTNGSSAGYTISLYFNNNELDGKTPASLKIAKTSAASVAGANGSNTILVTPTITTLGSDVTVFTASFTGFSRFFLVDAAVTLPVGIVYFKGNVTNDGNSLLEWKTSYEKNNDHFDIELSRDGIVFAALDALASKGNNDFGNSYNYLHVRPVKGVNYYRLKQVDKDGRVTYSNVIHLSITNDGNSKPYVSPNPVQESLKLNFVKLTTAPVQLEVLSADLKTVRRETVPAGSLNYAMSVNKLASGVYFIRMVVAGKTEVLRFVKD